MNCAGYGAFLSGLCDGIAYINIATSLYRLARGSAWPRAGSLAAWAIRGRSRFDASHDLGCGNDNEVNVFVDTAPPHTPDIVRLGESWTFRLGEHRVSEAAQRVAKWLQENEPRLRRPAEQ